MRRNTNLLLPILLFLMGATACETPNTLGCPLIAHNISKSTPIEYRLILPSGCPVDLKKPGEKKFAAAALELPVG